ncbi:MAG: hypothetical protein K9J06_00495 [Flavobacteriales bacterium]|nr:hypothetical protein [Flavobacteriales bacterium]
MAEKIAKVSFAFCLLTPTQKGLFGDNVLAEMNAHIMEFPTPDIPLPDLLIANNDLKLKTQQAMNGDKGKILERDESEKEWITLFRKEAQYVERIASGNKVLINHAGFLSTDTEVQPIPKPDMAVLTAWGNKAKGSIHAEIEPLSRCKGFVFMAANLPPGPETMSIKDGQLKLSGPTDGELVIILGTKRKVDFQGLTSGTKYYITALGFNAAGPGDISVSTDVIAP